MLKQLATEYLEAVTEFDRLDQLAYGAKGHLHRKSNELKKQLSERPLGAAVVTDTGTVITLIQGDLHQFNQVE